MRAVCNHPHISMRICPGLSQPDLAACSPGSLSSSSSGPFVQQPTTYLHHKCMHHEMHACMPGPHVLPHATSICHLLTYLLR